MTSPELAAVLFDWGGTLTPWHAVDVRASWLAYAGAYHRGTDDRGADNLDAPDAVVLTVAERLHRAEDAAWAAARDANRSSTLLDVVRAAGLDPLGAGHGPAMTAYEAAWEPHTWTDPDAEPTIRALRDRGLRVGLLSNTLWSRQTHERILHRDRVLALFDAVVVSSEIEWTKPHPSAFATAMAAVGVTDPARVAFVGDRPFDDIHGAHSAGMRTVLVPHSQIPPAQHGPAAAEPDAVIDRLFDLVAVVDRWLAGATRPGPS